MVFNSYIFILLFLPVSLIGYYLTGKLKKPPVSDWWLVFVSFLFYLYGGIGMLCYIVPSLLINYSLSRFLLMNPKKRLLKVSLFFTIALNVLVLCLFKYTDLFNSFVPFGISFITFGQIAYIVDSYRNETADDTLPEYILYIMWFPKVIQGPLLKHSDFIKSLRASDRNKINFTNLSDGLIYLVTGMFKKMFIADSIGKVVDYGIQYYEGLGFLSALVVVLGYTLQIYMDFSGYSDMAYGISEMFNIAIPQNFNSPYKAVSVTDFWKRWHISLSDFLREYIYFPLGGSRNGSLRTYLNILIVFAISGIWHGDDLTFLCWGMLHGLMQVLERMAQNILGKVVRPIRIAITFIIVNIGWLLFRAPDFKVFSEVFKRLFSFKGGWADEYMLPMTDLLGLNNIFDRLKPLSFLSSYSSIVMIVVGFGICFFAPNIYEKNKEKTFGRFLLVAFVFIIEICCMANAMTSFIYFDF